MNKKTVALVVTIISIVFLVVAGTYAFWYWSSIDNNKTVLFNTSSGIDSSYIVYDEGESSFIGNFQPTDTFCESVNTTISFYKTEKAADIALSATIYMDVNYIDENISSSSDVYWIITKGDNSITCDSGLSSSDILNYGNFNGVNSSNTIILSSEISVTNVLQQFTVWIWIDGASENLESIVGGTIDTNIWTEITTASQPEAPVLDSGMIPVTIADNGVVTTISSDDSAWYNYGNQKWANAVLVNTNATDGVEDSHSRQYYLDNLSNNVVVSESDILAYYVWIPAFKYRQWTSLAESFDSSTRSQPQAIDVSFVNSENYKSTQSSGYVLHPAFWWNESAPPNQFWYSDVKYLPGIWVGKFETSTDTSLDCYTSSSEDNCIYTEQIPKVLPNVHSLVYQNINNQFQTALKFSGGQYNTNGIVAFSGNNFYGLTSSVDSHMMKNDEWAAVAYLSHSQYGINQEVRINNNKNFTTGCGASNENGSSTSECQIAYGGANKYPQSTTGNITGVFDMSGGAWEYVMGWYDLAGESLLDCIGEFSNVADASGFCGFSLPNINYLSYYYSGENYAGACGNLESLNCRGDAMYETLGWYSDSMDGITYTPPSGFWTLRGGFYPMGNSAGTFGIAFMNGSAQNNISFRSVLTIPS